MRELVIKDLNKSYGKVKALNNINLKMKEGMYGLLGPNGAGKTTLMRILTTLIEKDSGDITYGEVSWKDENQVRTLLGYLPQHFSMYKNIKIYEILDYLATLKNIDNTKIKEEIDRVLKVTGLYEDKDKKVKALSGGMLRRLGIAQAILGDPKIIIVDEPTTGLDPEKRIEFRNLLNDLVGDRIIIISTHIVEDIEGTCDQVCVIEKGNIIYSGEVAKMRSLAKGKICEGIFSKDEFREVKKHLKVISSKYIEKGVIVRFVKDEKIQVSYEVKDVDPTLEDAYFCIIGEKSE